MKKKIKSSLNFEYNVMNKTSVHYLIDIDSFNLLNTMPVEYFQIWIVEGGENNIGAPKIILLISNSIFKYYCSLVSLFQLLQQ